MPPDMPLHVAAREMAARWIRHLPVAENGQLLGVVSMRDVTGVFGALGAGDSQIDVEHESTSWSASAGWPGSSAATWPRSAAQAGQAVAERPR